MDAVGILGLVLAVSKELYTYYKGIKHCDDDIKAFREQLLSLQAICAAVTTTLEREGVKAESHALVEPALRRCSDAADQLLFAADKVKKEEPQLSAALAKLRVLGRRAVYPFKKDTISGLSDNVKRCQDGLDAAVTLLGLNVSASTADLIRAADDKIASELQSLESGLQDLQIGVQTASDSIGGSLERQAKMITDDADRKKAESIVNSLYYDELHRRHQSIADAVEGDMLASLETLRSQDASVARFLTFLDKRPGLFWIQGKAASGKSTLMKFLADPLRVHDLTKTWSAGSTTIASHYFWVPGRPIQKSQHGFLQSLLHQVLRADLSLVPLVCGSRWTSNLSSAWSVNELWKVLQHAITASNRRLTVFVDGLDECEPESEHGQLASKLKTLASQMNVKMVVSSRPWPIFQHHFDDSEHTIVYERINWDAITGYFCGRVESIPAFEGIDWSLAGRHRPCNHPDEEAQELVCKIVRKADGNFLWLTLILNAVCPQLASGRPVRAVRKRVDDFPNELEEYFRDLVFRRIHKSWISETAMVLKIALGGFLSMSQCWLICDYVETGDTPLENARFALDLPYRKFSLAEIRNMHSRTVDFLSGCCRDLLILPPKTQDECEATRQFQRPVIQFAHRTVHDFLQTPEMQSLLDKHTPSSFKDPHMEMHLMLATWKLLVTDPTLTAALLWSHTVRWNWLLHDMYTGIAGGSGSGISFMEIATEVQGCFLHWAMSGQLCIKDLKDLERYPERRALRNFVIYLAAYGLYDVASFILLKAPEILLTTYGRDEPLPILIALGIALRIGLSKDHGTLCMGVDERLLRMLIEHGANVNHLLHLTIHERQWTHEGMKYKSIAIRSTPWRLFLGRLSSNEQCRCNKQVEKPQDLAKSTGRSDAEPSETLSDFSDAGASETFSDPHIQRVVKMLLDHGAHIRFATLRERDGEQDPLGTLKEYLPRDSDLYDWTSILKDLEKRAADAGRRRRG